MFQPLYWFFLLMQEMDPDYKGWCGKISNDLLYFVSLKTRISKPQKNIFHRTVVHYPYIFFCGNEPVQAPTSNTSNIFFQTPKKTCWNQNDNTTNTLTNVVLLPWFSINLSGSLSSPGGNRWNSGLTTSWIRRTKGDHGDVKIYILKVQESQIFGDDFLWSTMVGFCREIWEFEVE